MRRRRFLSRLGRGSLAILTSGLAATGCRSRAETRSEPRFATRGVVLVPEDLSLADWPERAARAGLTTVALHHQSSPRAVVDLVRSDRGARFLERCRRLGLEIEYELHAMRELLPRDLFATAPDLFRMDEEGHRSPDSNCCVSSARALGVVAENAVRLARELRPTTGRYFLWGDDGLPWCRCPACRALTDSEQALVLENRVLGALRELDSRASLAHLAYTNTLDPPRQVAPSDGIFLEYAPIRRRYDIAYELQTGPETSDGLAKLDANLAIFPRETAQVLEYWLDVSRFSGWKRPAVKLPWQRDVVLRDVQAYRARGIRHVTTFAAWVDADYARAFGDPTFIEEYGRALAGP